nr:hypothetical protein [Tanacetum cinerariifolium]
MLPRMRTQSIGRPTVESLGGVTGVWVGRGGRPREGNDELADDLNGQGNDQGKERDCVYFNFLFTIKLPIGLNVFPWDPSPHGRISLPVSLLNSFHREELLNSEMIS